MTPCRTITQFSLKEVAEKYRDQVSIETPSRVGTRLKSDEFDIRTHCLFREDLISGHHRDQSHEIMTFEFEHEVKQAISARNDEWALKFKQRMEFESAPGYDLVANDSKYHKSCRRDFMDIRPEGDANTAVKRSPVARSSHGPPSKRGRKVSNERFDSFVFAVNELEKSETGLMKVGEIIDLMATKTSDPFSYITSELLSCSIRSFQIQL